MRITRSIGTPCPINGHVLPLIVQWCLVLGAFFGMICAAQAVSEETVVVNYTAQSELVVLDLATGARTLLSGPSRGAGPDMPYLFGIAREPGGTFVAVSNASPAALFRIDPATGDRTILSGPTGSGTAGTGANLAWPSGLATAADGSILVISSTSNAVYRVDPATGNRAVIASSSVGSGAAITNPYGGIVESGGALVVALDRNPGSLLRINLTTLARTVVSASGTGTGPDLVWSQYVTRSAGGTLFVSGLGKIYSVDPVTGNRAIVSSLSSPAVGTGAMSNGFYGVSIDSADNIFTGSGSNDNVVRASASTGDRVVFSGSGAGSGFAWRPPMACLLWQGVI